MGHQAKVRMVVAGMFAALLLAVFPARAADDVWAAALAVAQRSFGVRPEEDAAGAVDGNTERRFSFHTSLCESPFWQVDFGEVLALGRVVVFNRHLPERAARLRILLSRDGEEWQVVYARDGEPFSVLERDVAGAAARHLRLQLPEPGYLHLAEVQVFAPDGETNLAYRRPATQSSVSQWSSRSIVLEPTPGELAAAVMAPLFEELSRAGRDPAALRGEMAALLDAQVPLADRRWPGLHARIHDWRRGISQVARDRLIARGIGNLLFVRRQTLNATHVYTEHDEGQFRPGGGLCVLDLHTGEVREIAHELTRTGVVNRFDLCFDARRIVFDFKPSAAEGYRLYEVGVDGSGLRQLTGPDASAPRKTDDMQPCFLPCGDVVFVTTRPRYGVLCASGDRLTVGNLWRLDAATGRLRPLSNSPLNEQSPTLLPDGRILYKRWEYLDKAAGNVKGLWAMRPDGSLSVELYGNEIAFPETMIYGRPIPGTVGEIVFLGASHFGNNAMGTVITIDTAANPRLPESMRFVTGDIHALAHVGFHFRDAEGRWVHDRDGRGGRLFKDPYPVHAGLFIASHKPAGFHWADPAAYELCLLDSHGDTLPLHREPTMSAWHPLPLVPRARPPEPQMVRDDSLAARDMAQVMVMDIYQGLEDVPRGTIRHIRILEQVGRPWAARKTWEGDRRGHAHSAIGDGSLSVKVQHGVVPVEADGSAHFLVPAMRAVYFQALDENYMAVQTQRTYVNYMAGEVRSCVGCHQERSAALAMTAFPEAAARPPSRPAPQPGESAAAKVFDYERQIQPIWDRRCISCHSQKERKGDLVLEGTPRGVFSESYENLVALGRTPRQVLGRRAARNEDAASLGQDAVRSLPAYALGSHTSPLPFFLGNGSAVPREPAVAEYAARLREAHAEVRLDEGEFVCLVNWLDVNALFHPSYWGRLHERWQGHPNYRPAVTFEEARSRELPESVRLAEESAAP